jgi:hypothetical protein
MIELLVPQAFAFRILRPFGKESVEAGLSVLFDVTKKRVRDFLAVMVLGKRLAAHAPVERDFFHEYVQGLEKVHGFFVAGKLDLLVDDIVDELALDNKLGGEILEKPDFFRIYYWMGFDIRRNVLIIVLPLAPVPDPVFGKGPGIDFEKEGIQIRHRVLLGRRRK